MHANYKLALIAIRLIVFDVNTNDMLPTYTLLTFAVLVLTFVI
jgi:hypothetical protein